MRFCILVNIFCLKADQAGDCPCEEFFCYFQQPRRLGLALVVYMIHCRCVVKPYKETLPP